MKFAVSNTALPALEHASLLPFLREMGFAGLEVAPAQVWTDTWRCPDAASVTAYRHAAQAADLEIVGLNSLLLGQPGLGIFQDAETVKRTEDFLVHLSSICRDLGGRTLILGSGRQLNGLPPERAWIACHAFLERLLPRIEEHGTMLCFAPLGSAQAGFCHTATNCRILATAVDHPSFGLQLNSCALTENGESGHAIFSAIYGHLEHFTINEPGLVPLGDSGMVDHPAMRRHLSASGYHGWVSVEQRAGADPLGDLGRSARFLADCYLRKDNLSLDLRRQARVSSIHHN
jgi:sugar phosphate isomerase/epimerase